MEQPGKPLTDLDVEELIEASISTSKHATRLLRQWAEHRNIEDLSCAYRMMGGSRNLIRIIIQKGLNRSMEKMGGA